MKELNPSSRVKRNSVVSPKNSKTRNGEVRQQTKDFLKWKRKRNTDIDGWLRLHFHPSKRMFGEHVSSARFQNMIKEMMLKVSLDNVFRRMT